MSKTVKDTKVEVESKFAEMKAPILPYQPRLPKRYRPKIGMIGCGGISATHLQAYSQNGLKVVAFCDLIEGRAKSRRDEYFPKASVTTDHKKLLANPEIEVVDIATHPSDRINLIEDSLKAGKHVLSQKPFVLDIATGERLINIAKENGVTLAVNQNGRWSPHMSYLREAVAAGLIGDVLGIHAEVHWDHTWVKGTPFQDIEDLVLYDFAIHWFDFVSTLIPNRQIKRIYATKSFAVGQELKVPMMAQVAIEFDGGQASLVFDAHTKYGNADTTYIAGTDGSLLSSGQNLSCQEVQFYNKSGVAKPKLTGSWFPGGFLGSMGELLRAIEEKREPSNSAQNNLRSLELAFAAIASANDRRVYEFGETKTLWTPTSAPR